MTITKKLNFYTESISFENLVEGILQLTHSNVDEPTLSPCEDNYNIDDFNVILLYIYNVNVILLYL